MGRIVVVLALLVLSVLLPSATFAGGVALAVPSCQTNVQSVQLQGLQAYAAPVALAVPVYAQQQQFVQVLGVQQTPGRRAGGAGAASASPQREQARPRASRE
jgi:hypothetical protein